MQSWPEGFQKEGNFWAFGDIAYLDGMKKGGFCRELGWGINITWSRL